MVVPTQQSNKQYCTMEIKREIEEEEGGGAAMPPPPLRRLPSAVTASSVLGRATSGFYSMRAPSPIVRAMGTRIDPPPTKVPLAPPPPPPPPPLLSQAPAKRPRGRPRNCDRLMQPPGFFLCPPGSTPALSAHVQSRSSGLQPHVLKIDVGEDILSRILQVSLISRKAVCVLSVLGSAREAKLLHSSHSVLHHKGPLEIIRIFGSISTREGPGFGSLSVTLASADCSVVGGVVAGPLIAATTVQAIVGSFFYDASETKRTPMVIANHPNSQVVTGYGVACYPNPHVPTGNVIRHHPNSEVVIGNGSTHQDNSHAKVGYGGTNSTKCLVAVDNGGTCNPKSQDTIADKRTNNDNSATTSGHGYESACYPDSRVTASDRSAPSVEVATAS